MELIKILNKIVESPNSIENYIHLKDHFSKNNMPDIEKAIAHLLKVRYAPDNNDTTK